MVPFASALDSRAGDALAVLEAAAAQMAGVHSVDQVAVDRNAEVGHPRSEGPFVEAVAGDRRLTSSSTSSITGIKTALTNILSPSDQR